MQEREKLVCEKFYVVLVILLFEMSFSYPHLLMCVSV